MRLMMLYMLGMIAMSVMAWTGQAFQSMNGRVQKRPGSWYAQPRRTIVDLPFCGLGGKNSGLGGGGSGGGTSSGKMNNDNNDDDDGNRERDVEIVTSSSEKGKCKKRIGNWFVAIWEDELWRTLAKLRAVFGLYNFIKEDFTKDIKDQLKGVEDQLKDVVKTETLNSVKSEPKSEIQSLKSELKSEIRSVNDRLLIYFLSSVIVTLVISKCDVVAVKD